MTQEAIDEIMSVLTYHEKTELWSILSKTRARAMKELGTRKMDLYPPADYSSVQPTKTTE